MTIPRRANKAHDQKHASVDRSAQRTRTGLDSTDGPTREGNLPRGTFPIPGFVKVYKNGPVPTGLRNPAS